MTDTMTARTAPVAAGVAPWGVAAAIGLAGVALQSLAFLNHDVSWVLWSSGRLLDGGTFGHEIVAANPPLIWWVSALPMALSRLTGLTPLLCFYLFMGAALALSLMAADRLLRDVMGGGARLFFLSVAALVLGLGAGRDFGQRENLTAIAALPYVLLVAARLRGETAGGLLAALIGGAAAIGFAFKPHLMAVPLLLEGLVFWRLGFRRMIARPELLAAIAVVIAYVAAVVLFARPWLTEAAPAIAQVYWAFNVPDTLALAVNAMPSAATLLLALLLAGRSAASRPRGRRLPPGGGAAVEGLQLSPLSRLCVRLPRTGLARHRTRRRAGAGGGTLHMVRGRLAGLAQGPHAGG